MSRILLLISRQEREYLSFHDNDSAALDALVRYIDDHWAEADLPEDAADPDPLIRIEAWVGATQALYFIAEASVGR
jgi:hypothetical protein